MGDVGVHACGDDASFCGLYDRMAFLYDTGCGNRLPCNITGIIRQVFNFILTNNLHRHLNQLTSVSVEPGNWKYLPLLGSRYVEVNMQIDDVCVCTNMTPFYRRVGYGEYNYQFNPSVAMYSAGRSLSGMVRASSSSFCTDTIMRCCVMPA